MRGANVRVGGSSADASTFGEAGDPLPTNVTYLVTDSDLEGFAAAVQLWSGSVTVDVNLGRALPGGYLSRSAAHAAAAARILGESLDGIEIGNEPDGFGTWGGHLRPPSYSPQAYYVDFDEALAAFASAGVDARRLVQGATYCCGEKSWGADLRTYAERFASSLRSISYHRYPDVNNATTSVATLLDDGCASGVAAVVAPFAVAALSQGVPFFIGEGNSVNGGGLPNISDVWASGLWAADVMFNVASVGATRWNWHGGPGGSYAAITYRNASNPDEPPVVRPIFYGLATFAHVAANGSALFAVTEISGLAPLVKAWAARDGVTGAWRAVLIAKDLAAAAPQAVAFAPPPGSPAARAASPLLSVRRVAAATGSAFAKDGINFGGLSWDGAGSDGAPSGAPAIETVVATDGGVAGSGFTYAYRLQLAPLSMAMLEWA